MTLTLSGGFAWGQDSHGAIIKRPRTLADYKPATLKDIVALDSENRGSRQAKEPRDAILPFLVRVAYTNSQRPLSSHSNDLLRSWARCCAGNPDHYTRNYEVESRFVENGISYWLPIQKDLVPQFQNELKSGHSVDLYLIRLHSPGTSGSVLLVEKYQKTSSSAGKKTKREAISISKLNSSNVIGFLGYPLGEILTIEGIAAGGDYTRRKADAGKTLLRVQAVNGEGLKSEVIFQFASAHAGITTPAPGTRFKYVGYETGGFSGLPEKAFDYIPRVPDSGYSFTTSFVILRQEKLE